MMVELSIRLACTLWGYSFFAAESQFSWMVPAMMHTI